MKHKKEKAVLALGEVTGHSHQLLEPVQILKKSSDGLAQELVFDQDVSLVHEEHNTLVMPKGEVKVVLQREVDLLGEVRKVMD